MRKKGREKGRWGERETDRQTYLAKGSIAPGLRWLLLYPNHPRPGPRPSSCVLGPRTAPLTTSRCPVPQSGQSLQWIRTLAHPPAAGEAAGRWHWTNSQPHHLPSLNLTAMTAKRGSRDSARHAQWDQGGNAQDMLGAGWTPELYLLPFPLPTVCEAGPASGPWCPSASDRAAVSLRRHPRISVL